MDNEAKLMNEIQKEDIPENYDTIVDMIGITAFIELCSYVMGDYLYLPKIDTIQRNVRNRKIRQEYTGYNQKELARKYKLTVKQIKNIISS